MSAKKFCGENHTRKELTSQTNQSIHYFQHIVNGNRNVQFNGNKKRVLTVRNTSKLEASASIKLAVSVLDNSDDAELHA